MKKPEITIQNDKGGVRFEIFTERLYLSNYSEHDFQNCLAMYSDPKLMRFFDKGRALDLGEVSALVNERGLKYSRAGVP